MINIYNLFEKLKFEQNNLKRHKKVNQIKTVEENRKKLLFTKYL